MIKPPTLLVLCIAWPCVHAQTNAPAAPRRGFTPPVVSPEVAADRQVTFRLRAPEAAGVALSGQWGGGTTSLRKDTNGLWSVTVGPINPGVWEYSFTVDGVRMIDPGNPWIKPMREPRTSILHLPATPPAVHDWQDVPHGVVRYHSYFSKPLGRLRELAVYTPPGYDGKSGRYPTLYLQHGSGDNHATWTVHGKAHWILDNLVAEKRARPMVVVMMDGHATAPGPPGQGRQSNTEGFERDLVETVLPLVEKEYRVKKGAAHRAIAGLSMGGGQSLTTGLNHPDLFAWVIGFSSSVPAAEAIPTALAQPAALNKQLKLLWIGCGKDDFLLKRNQEFIEQLRAKGIAHDWQLTDGDHSWPVWRRYLAEVTPRLF